MALNEELVLFVKEGLRQRLGRPQMQDVLLRAGWPADQVGRALSGFVDADFPIPVPRPTASVGTREAFFYCVMFTTLVMSTYSFGLLVFSLIDQALPQGAPVPAAIVAQNLRWALSAFIVTFPLFLSVAGWIRRSVRREPLQRASRVRRQVTYLTLFITSCVLIGDLIAAIYTLLGGDLELSFLLKALTVGGIAGAVFVYYAGDLRRGEEEPEA